MIRLTMQRFADLVLTALAFWTMQTLDRRSLEVVPPAELRQLMTASPDGHQDHGRSGKTKMYLEVADDFESPLTMNESIAESENNRAR